MGTGESQESMRVISSESVLRSVPYATHRTFYYPCATIKSKTTAKLASFHLFWPLHKSVYIWPKKDQPNKQKPSRFRNWFFKGRIRKVLHVNIFCYILLHFCRFHSFGQQNRKGVFLKERKMSSLFSTQVPRTHE